MQLICLHEYLKMHIFNIKLTSCIFAALWKSVKVFAVVLSGRAEAKEGEFSFEVYVLHELNNIKFNLIFIKFIWNVCISLASSCFCVCVHVCVCKLQRYRCFLWWMRWKYHQQISQWFHWKSVTITHEQTIAERIIHSQAGTCFFSTLHASLLPYVIVCVDSKSQFPIHQFPIIFTLHAESRNAALFEQKYHFQQIVHIANCLSICSFLLIVTWSYFAPSFVFASILIPRKISVLTLTLLRKPQI